MEINVANLEKAIFKGWEKKVSSLLDEFVLRNDKSILDFLYLKINSDLNDGVIIGNLVKAYFRLNRTSDNDASTIYQFSDFKNINIQESLLEVLGYDKMVPPLNDQNRIIEKYFYFGDDTDYQYFTDPRYGLAAACAGWDFETVKPFLEYCIKIEDAPLKYVAQNSLKRKYVKLR